ncbi:hypothetical protein FQA39_LY01329 [Lamprigera yunnana]|nr:hypothetical protein FQA39_LY01329 [Lamprigera yunnana]
MFSALLMRRPKCIVTLYESHREIGKEKLPYFLKNEGEWAGATEDKSLFDQWTLWKTKMGQENSTNLVAQSATIVSPTIDPSGIQNLAYDMNVCTQLTICFPDDQQSAPGSAIILSRNEHSPGRDIDEAILMIDQPSTSSLIPVLTRIDQPTTSGLNLPSPFKRAPLWPQPVQLRSTKQREKTTCCSHITTNAGLLREEVSLDELKEGTFILAKFKGGKKKFNSVCVPLCHPRVKIRWRYSCNEIEEY